MDWLNDAVALLPNLVDSLVYAAIALITLLGFAKCIFPVMKTGSALRRGIRRLDKNVGKEFPVWKDAGFLGGKLQNSWQRFLLNAEQLTFRGLSLNIDEYINDESVVHIPGNGSFAGLVPGLLTSLGILGTFIGLMRGLTGIDFTNAERLIAAIPSLLQGMSYAFLTSIAGISCSLVFNMIYHLATGRAFKAIEDFSDVFSQLVLLRAPDEMVQLICQNQDRNMLLHNVSEDISVRFAGSVETAITRAMMPVTASMDKFIAGATREQMDGIGRIVTHFIVKMNESLSGQFLALGKTMTEINQNQLASNDTLRDSLMAAGNMVNDLNALHLSSNEILDRFELYIKSLSERSAQESSFESKSSDLLYKMYQSQEQLARYLTTLNDFQAKLERSLKDYTATSDSILLGIKAQGESNSSDINNASANFKATSNLLSNSYSSFVENIAEGLGRSLAMFEENMHDMLTLLSERLDKLSAVTQGGANATKEQLDGYSALQKTMTEIKNILASKPVLNAEEK